MRFFLQIDTHFFALVRSIWVRFWLISLLLLAACSQTTAVSVHPTAPPTATIAPTHTPEPSPTATPDPHSPTFDLAIFDEDLRDGWTVENSWGLDIAREDATVKSGNHALAITPKQPYSGLFFSAKANQPTTYRQQQFLSLTFWLNPGSTPLDPARLTIALTGSDEFNFWSRETSSAPQDDTPLTSEIPLTVLGFSKPFPANEWTRVEFWFQQTHVPNFANITGAYLKTNQPDTPTFYVDDVMLVALRDTIPPVPVKASNLNATTVSISFNKDLQSDTASNPANYRVDGRQPTEATYKPAGHRVILTLEQPLVDETAVSITLNNLTDQAIPPNAIADGTKIAFTAVNRQILVDVGNPQHPISPYIYGMALTDPDYLGELGINLHSWGGNANSRYNWQIGNAWSAARDWNYQNGSYNHQPSEGSISDNFVRNNEEREIASLLTIPMVGWVAGDTEGCAFPLPDGSCWDAGGASCDKPGEIAVPSNYSTEAPPEFMGDWLTHLVEQGHTVPFLSMGNEPMIWGVTHYDVHPNCTTYNEYVERFIAYTEAVSAASPDSEIIGPNSCCWWYYWNSMPGEADRNQHDDMAFLPWFLQQMAAYEAETGDRLLDVLGVHYYPAGLFNDDTSPDTAAHRLRETRSLWDPTYVDESWIGEPVYLIPRMKKLIDEYYPGTEFGIGEWNWGADKSMNGAVTIADVLGIFGREDLYYAAYWTHPEQYGPGYYAFKMYTNFDNAGTSFGGSHPVSIPAAAENPNSFGSYAALDADTNTLYLMLVNKQPEQKTTYQVVLNDFSPATTAAQYRYSDANVGQITQTTIEPSSQFSVELPPYSITLLVIPSSEVTQ